LRQSKILNQEFPGFAPGWDISSHIALKIHGGEVALNLIDRALSIDENNFAFLAHKAVCLLVLQRAKEAQELIERLGASEMLFAAQFDTLGNIYSLSKDQQRALICFEKAAELEPDNAHYHLNMALVRQATGDLNGAESSFDRTIALDPENHEAWLHRSRLRKQTASSNHAADLESLITRGIQSWRGEMAIRYALAKEYEDLGNFKLSFQHLDIGSTLRRSHMRHDAQADLDTIDAIIECFSEEYFHQSVVANENEEPIFIVGFPRTGTTLVERILGSHSEVYAAGELNNFAENLNRQIFALDEKKPANRQQYVAAATRINFEQLGGDYISSTRPHTGNTARFIDKLPLNFLYCGLILKAMPNARIIHLTRHPMDTCFAVYKTLFKQAYPFSYDLKELGHYFLAYRKLMSHWHTCMPGKVLDVSYEKLTTNLESESRRLISFCGLEWEDACLEFHMNSAPSMTASLAQVRQPVYTTSVGRWRNYRKELRILEELFN